MICSMDNMPYELFTFQDCQWDQHLPASFFIHGDPLILHLWWQARARAEEAYEDFGRHAVNLTSCNQWEGWPIYIQGRRSRARMGVRHLVYWYEGGWVYHRYSVGEWVQWLDRNRFSEMTNGALVELRSDLLEDDEGRCAFCGRMFRICNLASTWDATACPL
jgi:hypothetical protein